MFATALAGSAYDDASQPIRTARNIEYDAFSRITRDLRAASAPDIAFSTLARALHANRLLWDTLAADLAVPANGLPADLKSRLFYLAEFSRQHASRVLAGEATTAILVEINMAVMRGLASRGHAG